MAMKWKVLRPGRYTLSLIWLVTGVSAVPAQTSTAQWGLDNLATSLLWVAAAIAFAGVAIGAGILFGLRSRRRD
jgi:hypothetical protein